LARRWCLTPPSRRRLAASRNPPLRRTLNVCFWRRGSSASGRKAPSYSTKTGPSIVSPASRLTRPYASLAEGLGCAAGGAYALPRSTWQPARARSALRELTGGICLSGMREAHAASYAAGRLPEHRRGPFAQRRAAHRSPQRHSPSPRPASQGSSEAPSKTGADDQIKTPRPTRRSPPAPPPQPTPTPSSPADPSPCRNTPRTPDPAPPRR
jgi:hypothetical protein